MSVFNYVLSGYPLMPSISLLNNTTVTGGTVNISIHPQPAGVPRMDINGNLTTKIPENMNNLTSS